MQNSVTPSLHPMLWIAGLAVALFSLVGLAALMGWIPTSTGDANNSTSSQQAVPHKSSVGSDSRASSDNRTSTRAASCRDCGTIESIQEINHRGKASGVGVLGGAVLGGVLGNQVGKGNGNDAATVVGAVGGAVAGNEVEKRMSSTTTYKITVRLNDGATRVFEEATQPAWRVGEKVKVVNGALRSNS